MYSTSLNITDRQIKTNENSTTNKYITYPDKTNKRQTEGGLRLKNKYKHSIENKPLVTIITVVFNSEKTLERSILSVLNQTYDNIEYIIIDGGSTDSTIDIIKKYGNYIDYYVSEPDDGLYYAMNKGLMLASGNYIGILGSDDYYYDFALSINVDAILDKGLDITASYADVIDKNGIFLYKSRLLPFNDEAFIQGIPANHQTMFISKGIYNKVGYYDTSFKIIADTDLVLKAIDFNPKYSLLENSIVSFTQGGASSNLKELWRENALVLSKRLPKMTLKELDALSKFAGGYIGTYNFDFIKTFIFKNNFSDNQKKIIYKRCLESDASMLDKIIEKIGDNEGIYKIKSEDFPYLSSEEIKKLQIFSIYKDAISILDIDEILEKHYTDKKLLDILIDTITTYYPPKIFRKIEKPKVSIIIPIYRKEIMLAECLFSIINQTERDIEIIIVDDISNYGENIVEPYMKKDERIVYIKHKENMGPAIARLTGAQNAVSDFIYFVDNDDKIELDTIETLINENKKYQADLVISRRYNLTKNNVGYLIEMDEKYLNKVMSNIEWKDFLLYNNTKYFYITNVLFNKNIFLKASIFVDKLKNITGPEDLLTHMIIIRYVEKVVLIDKGLYYLRDCGENNSGSLKITSEKFMNMFNNYSTVIDIINNLKINTTDSTLIKFYKKIQIVIVSHIVYHFNRVNKEEVDFILPLLYEINSTPSKKKKLTFLEYIFSVYTREKFIEIIILGVKISIRRKKH